jgi:predicted NBD/HSP70 family sugar kinase
MAGVGGGVRATVRDLRRANRSLVLRRLFLGGALNRVVLAQATGLSGGSITKVVSDLLQEGLVVEIGLEESDGGRPRVLLQLNPEFGAVIGIDLGETGIRVGAFDLAMNEIAATAVPLHPQHESVDVVIDAIAEAVERLQVQLAAEDRQVLGVGVGVPGVVEYDGSARVHAPSIGWADVSLDRVLRDRVGLPVLVENGAKTLGQAEMWLGAGRGVEHAVVTLWGTGVGAAIFTNGMLYRGAASSAGEWGHASIVVGGKRCRCGGAGCLEAYIGAGSLLEQWSSIDARAGQVSDPDAEEWVDQLLEAAETDTEAARVLDDAAVAFGVAAGNLANLFNPERIVVGGWLGLKLGPRLLPKIRSELDAQALAYPAARVTVELGRLGADAVALGASTLVVEQLLASGGRPSVNGRPR